MDPYVALARNAIEHYIKTGAYFPQPDDLASELVDNRAGVFVSLHTNSNNALRGCIGTFAPTQDSIAQEIIHLAPEAATGDPRFDPVQLSELSGITIHVDVLSPPEPVKGFNDLNPKKYGLIVSNSSNQRGLLLPDIGVDTVEEQFAICCNKGGIDPNDPTIKLERFTVKRQA